MEDANACKISVKLYCMACGSAISIVYAATAGPADTHIECPGCNRRYQLGIFQAQISDYLYLITKDC